MKLRNWKKAGVDQFSFQEAYYINNNSIINKSNKIKFIEKEKRILTNRDVWITVQNKHANNLTRMLLYTSTKERVQINIMIVPSN